ncbi:MAG: hypothetical protein ACK514_12390 [Bacteroidota bacterium]|jgi:hypothetical protein|nr:hypothetical protein [Cytophagales bacterium]MCE2957863.1 hypothetical protein [Flammeovirgaceae bacterium]MCZ8071966.1 hypothetical protein [Cytophagales bacterium]
MHKLPKELVIRFCALKPRVKFQVAYLINFVNSNSLTFMTTKNLLVALLVVAKWDQPSLEKFKKDVSEFILGTSK